MTLRIKLLLVVSSVVLCLLAVYFFGLRVLIVQQLARLDDEEALRDLQRCSQAGQNEENYLDAACHQLARSEDMRRFVLEGAPGFLDDILHPDVLEAFDLDLILIAAADGAVLQRRAHPAHPEAASLPDAFPADRFAPGAPLLSDPANPGRARDGFLGTPAGPLQVSSKAVLAPDGALLGTVVVGRLANPARMARIREQTQVQVTLHPLPEAPGDPLHDVWVELQRGGEITLRNLDDDTVAAYGAVTGVLGEPVFLVETQSPRRIARAARQVMRSSITSTAAAGVAIVLVILIFLHVVVVAPVRRLTDHMQAIGASGAATLALFPHRYSGEMGRLAQAFNSMLGQLGATKDAMAGANSRLAEEMEQRGRVVEDLRESELRLRSLTESAADGIISANVEGRIASWNRGAQQIFGYAPGEIIGESLTRLMPERYRTGHAAGMARHKHGGGGEHIGKALQLHGLRKDGTEFPLELTLGMWETREGRFFSAILRDISERKQAEDALAAAKDAAESANLAKSQFLASMSHEIRTPMNGVIGMTELLAATDLAAPQRRFVDAIRESADNLLEIINDILDLSKIEAGRVTLDRMPFQLGDLVQQIVWSLGPSARKKGLSLRCDLDEAAAAHYLGDPVRLRQVLVNLVGNAVKFTEHGECVVSVARLPRAAEGADCWLRFSVRDTGIGIPPDLHEVIFERFAQADASITRRYGGTGLGLAICKRLVELMGGRIAVESSPGGGSDFHFEIPLEPTDQVAESGGLFELAEDADMPRGLRVLVAEDTKMNQDLFTLFLEGQGHHVTLVEDGLQVLDALRKQRFDVVLMDVEMPEMDGVNATRILRDPAQGALDPEVPVIAVTAHALIGDRERFLDAGMNDYVAKPIDFRELRAALARAVAGRAPLHAAVAPTPDDAPVIERREALARLGGNHEALLRMEEIFAEDAAAVFDACRAALEQREADAARRAAHSLKSMAATIGAQRLSAAARDAELAAREQDWAGMADAAGRIARELDAALAALREPRA